MQSSQSTLDYFKLFKVFQLKKIQKTGLVKIIQDKELNRKIISVEGNISTSNFLAFQTANFPNVPFNERYLYIQAFLDPGKSFCVQVAFSLATKSFKAVYSTLYKNSKKHLENMVHLPLGLPSGRWSLAVVDLYELGLHFGFKAQEMKMIFRVSSIQIRASSKVKGLFQSDYLFSVDKMPKDMMFPLKKQEHYFEKYHYFVESTDPLCLKYVSQVKNVIPKHKDQVHTVKQSKSKQEKITVSASKNRKSIQKQQSSEKINENGNNKSTKGLPGVKKSQNNPSLPPTNTRRKQQKMQQKQNPKQEQIQQIQIEHELTPPVPQAMISLSLSCVQGFSLNIGNLMSVQSYLVKPVYMPVHKPIQLLAACDTHNSKVITGYIDGSFCIWDAIRKSPLGYFLSELSELKIILVDAQLSVVLVGLDRMKRQVINIISEGSVVFRQISNYNISGAVLVSPLSFEHGIVTFGFQNVRLWRINNEKSIIQGSNIYLGQSNRKVKYTAAVFIPSRDDTIIYVSDSNGFITTISVLQGKMLQSLKIDSCAIDQMLLLSDGRCLSSNESGTIRVIDLMRMQVQEEYALSNRIKHMHQLPSEEIILTHFNKSVGSLSLQTSMYSFLMRSHTAAVNGIVYCPLLNKVVSISKDNSIRIWQYVVDNAGAFQFRLQEQYQFVITGEQMVQVACGSGGKVQEVSRVIVGGDSGKLRSINIEKYVIQQQVILQSGPMSLSVSRNGKYVLCTYSSGNSYLLDSNLNILFKYLHNENQNKKRIKSWINGFNRVNKQFFIENVEEQRLQFYALKDPATPLYFIRFSDKKSQISFIGNRVYILTEGQLRLFEKGVMIQMVNMTSQTIQKRLQTCVAFYFPLMCMSLGQKLTVKVVTANLQEQHQLPESLSSIKIYYDSEKKEGLLICGGRHSHSLYVFTYQLHNVAESILCEVTDHEELKETVNQLQISFSNKTTVSGYANKRQSSVRNERIGINGKFQQNPKELKSLYQQQEALYEQVKQFLLPKAFQKEQRQQQQQNEEEQHQKQQGNVSNELGVLLNYGYQLRQDVEDGIGTFFWLSDNNSLILLTGGGRRILQHFFSVPIKHKIVSFPSAATSICLSPRSFQGLRYLSVSVGALVKLYNVDQQIGFIRSIDVISSTFLGAVIFQSAITRCNRYLLTLSYNSVNFDGKIYIHLVELSSGSVVSSSYLSLPPATNKYKGQQIKQAKQYRMMLNYLKSTLQFVVFNPQGLLYFYRVTSILTLQTLQLEELVPLCRDKLTSLTCSCFIGQDEQAVLAIGSENGSLVFIDCRTASILIACIAVLPTPITAISTAKLEEGDKLILFTNSPLLTVFSLQQGLNSLLAAIDPATQQSQGKRCLSVDGEVTARSNASTNGQQMILTKAGSLWLMDYADWVTVKVSSVHTLPISQAEVISGRQNSYLLSCSEDGSVKLSNLINLEQTLEIYKPRRQARCFSNSGCFLLVAFGEQCYIYDALTAERLESAQQLSSLGSFRLDAPIVAIRNIPSTQNYYILTETEVFIVFLSLRNKNKSELCLISTSQMKGSIFSELKSPLQATTANVQINKITDVQSSSDLIVNDHAPYDQFAVVSKVGRATVWSRKCLKRSYNPIDELSRVHQLAYYLIDAHAAPSAGAGLRFLSHTEYIWTVLEQGAVQVRNFKEHCVTRQIKLSVERLAAISCIGDDQLIFYAGDQHGYLCILSENGLLIDRIKAMDSPIKSISQWQTNGSQSLLLYGGKYAVTLSLPSK